MTKLMEKKYEALNKFDQLMNSYGMEAYRNGMSVCYPGDDLNIYSVSFKSKEVPVKGNKALMVKLENDGFCVQKYMREDRSTGRSYYVFFVTKSYRIDLSKYEFIEEPADVEATPAEETEPAQDEKERKNMIQFNRYDKWGFLKEAYNVLKQNEQFWLNNPFTMKQYEYIKEAVTTDTVYTSGTLDYICDGAKYLLEVHDKKFG